MRRFEVPLALIAWLAIGCGGSAEEGHSADGDGLPGTNPSAEVAHHLDSLLSVGEDLYDEGEYEQARAAFAQVLEEVGSDTASVAGAHALTWLARTAWWLGPNDLGTELGWKSLRFKEELGLAAACFDSHNILGLLAWDQSDYSQAVTSFAAAEEVALAHADTANLAKVLNNLALVHSDLGDYASARSKLLQARSWAQVAQDPLSEGRALINLGMLEREQGSGLAAMAYLLEARPVLIASGDPAGEVSWYGHLGNVLAETGEFGRAIAHIDTALVKSQEMGLPDEEASNLELLARLRAELGDHRQALRLLGEARAINAELGLDYERAMNLMAEAQIYAAIGDLGRALSQAAEGLRVHREMGARGRELEGLVTLAHLSLESGSPVQARAYLADADSLAQLLDCPSARITALLGAARLAESQEEHPRVLGLLSTPKVASDLTGSGQAWEAYDLMARAHAAMGDLESAVGAGRRAIQEIERVRSSFGYSGSRSRYLAERERVFGDQVLALLELERTTEAFQVSDGARGREFLESLATLADQAPGVAGEQLARGERVLKRISHFQQSLDDYDQYPRDELTPTEIEEVERLHSELEEARAEYDDLLVRTTETDPEGAALLGLGSFSPGEIQSALGEGEALVEYLLTPSAVVILVLRADTIVAVLSETPRDQITSRIRVVRGLLAEPGSDPDAIRSVTSALYDVLFRPVVESGAVDGVSRLLVVPHDEIAFLPLSALRARETDRYLSEDFALAQLPTAAALPALRRRSSGQGEPPRRLTVFAPFTTELPASGQEAEALAAVMDDARILTGRDATENRVRKALGEEGVVHIASHGILNAWNPLFSRIELYEAGDAGSGSLGSAAASDREDDGHLEAHEVMEMGIQAPLVFLSGCETGATAAWTTDFSHRQELATLGQSFLNAGASNVVASLWQIRDRGAAVFAEAFYAALEDGSPAEALARAQRTLMRDPDYGSPYYWAPYQLMGSGALTWAQ